MPFLVHALDHPDGLERRQAARADHLARAQRHVAEGTLLYATALLDDDGKMIGSVMVLDLPDRRAVDAWLADEPYVQCDAWDPAATTVSPCAVPPLFAPVRREEGPPRG